LTADAALPSSIGWAYRIVNAFVCVCCVWVLC
jgi:hypothetical protein